MKYIGLLLLLLCLNGASKAQVSSEWTQLKDSIALAPLPQIHCCSLLKVVATPTTTNPFYQWYCGAHAVSIAKLDCGLEGILLTISGIPSCYENEEAYLAEVYRGKNIYVKGKLYTP